LREWGVSEPTAEASSAALYRWDAAPSAADSVDGVDGEEDEAGPVKTRSYSRLRVFVLAAITAVVIVAAYMVFVGSDSQGGAPGDSPADSAASTPVAAGTPDAPPAEATPAAEDGQQSSAPEPDQPAPALATEAPAQEQNQPGNSLTLTFDPPRDQPSPSP
jgi:hypothetical protein